MNYYIQAPVKLKKLREDAKPLQYAHPGDSGMDVFVCALKRLDENKKPVEAPDFVDWIIMPGETVLACSGWAASIPRGTELQVRPTSGNGLKTKIRVPNAPGTVDSIYRGEIGVELENIGTEPFVLKKHAKIAQLVLCPVIEAQLEIVDDLDETDRGAAGYGSTGSMIQTEKSYTFSTAEGIVASENAKIGKSSVNNKCSFGCDHCNGGCH